MFWDKRKKSEGLPDLPAPQIAIRDQPVHPQFLADSEDEESQPHELPSFPDSPMHRGFSQSAIKEAVTNKDIRYENEENKYKSVEIPEYTGVLPAPPSIQKTRENKPIFVRIDKFQVARSSLDIVKEKLTEIEDLLKQIREVKAKEDAELSAWEAELENIKAHIHNVTTEIFDKAES